MKILNSMDSRMHNDKSFNLLDKNIRESFDGIQFKSMLFRSKQVAEGSIFPSASLLSTSGQIKQVHADLSKYTLVDFWYSHCTPCIQEFDELKHIYSAYSSKGFQVIGISIDKKSDELEWKKAIEKYNLIWTNLWDADGEMAKKYSIEVFPTNFLIDQSGKIIRKNISLTDLRNFLDRH